MVFLVRFAFLAAILGLALGLLLRPALGRKRFTLLVLLSLAPLVAHASYLAIVTWRAGVEAAALLPFVLAVAVLLAVAALLARRWSRRAPLLAAFLPAFAALVYLVIGSAMFSLMLRSTGVVPNAAAAAFYGLVTLASVTMLLPFVPESASLPTRLRWPRRRP